MLKVRDKYDHREEFCQILRSGRYLQKSGGGLDTSHGIVRACAIYAWAHATGVTGAIDDYGRPVSVYVEFKNKMGLDPIEVLRCNDGFGALHMTFEELAAWVEEQP